MTALWLVAMAAVLASGPTAVIVGPQRGNPGDLIVLDASQSRDAAGFAWVLADSDKTFLEFEGGRKVVFATGTPGRYTFVLVAANAGSDGKPLVAVARHLLTVGDPQPGPEPPRPPQPEPLPPGKYGLAMFARDQAARVAIDPATKVTTAQGLANSFDSLAATIAAGALLEPASIIAATQASNVSALGPHRSAWQPWGESLRLKLNAFSEGQLLVSPQDYAIAWREIATGLRAVKRQ